MASSCSWAHVTFTKSVEENANSMTYIIIWRDNEDRHSVCQQPSAHLKKVKWSGEKERKVSDQCS